MAKERGLSEMELNLRTILLQKIAGQSRSVVNNAIQTTKLAVGFFLQHGHKTLDQIQDEAEETEHVAPTNHNTRPTINPKDKEDYHILKRYIMGKIAMSQSIHDDLIENQAQALIEVLICATLTVDEMHGTYLALGKNEVEFYSEMRKQLERIYKQRGPPEMWFANFIGFVSEFLDGRALPGSSGRDGRTPVWYVCRNCQRPGLHLWLDCPHFKHESLDDFQYLTRLKQGYRPSRDIFYSLQALRRHIESVLTLSTKDLGERGVELCTLVTDNCVLALAEKKITESFLRKCKSYTQAKVDMVLFKSLAASSPFPTVIDQSVLFNIIRDYISNC